MIIFQIIFVKHPGYPFCDQRIIHDDKRMHYKIKTLIVHVQLWAYRNKSSTIMTHHWSFERPHSGIPKIMIFQIKTTHLQSCISNVSEAMLYICIAVSDQTVTVYLRGSWLEGICTISYTQIQLSESIIWSQHNNSDTNDHIKDICRHTSQASNQIMMDILVQRLSLGQVMAAHVSKWTINQTWITEARMKYEGYNVLLNYSIKK